MKKVQDDDLVQFNVIKALRRHIFVQIDKLNKDYRDEFPQDPWWFTIRKKKAPMMQKLAEFDEILVKVSSMYEENKQLRIPEQLADAEYSDQSDEEYDLARDYLMDNIIALRDRKSFDVVKELELLYLRRQSQEYDYEAQQHISNRRQRRTKLQRFLDKKLEYFFGFNQLPYHYEEEGSSESSDSDSLETINEVTQDSDSTT